MLTIDYATIDAALAAEPLAAVRDVLFSASPARNVTLVAVVTARAVHRCVVPESDAVAPDDARLVAAGAKRVRNVRSG